MAGLEDTGTIWLGIVMPHIEFVIEAFFPRRTEDLLGAQRKGSFWNVLLLIDHGSFYKFSYFDLHEKERDLYSGGLVWLHETVLFPPNITLN